MSKYLNVGLIKPGEDYKKMKPVKISISDKTYDLLYLSKFSWYSRQLKDDVQNDGSLDKIEDRLLDVFYLTVNGILEYKLGISPKEYDPLDVDSNENEIFIDIQLL